VALLYGYGRFTPEDVRATAAALAAYSVGLAAYSGVKVLVPICYAMGKARVAIYSSLLSVAANLALNLLFDRSLCYWGLALGTSITAFLNLGFLLFAVHNPGKHGRESLRRCEVVNRE
jgi:putative peptidoglycan lipid II flippase